MVKNNGLEYDKEIKEISRLDRVYTTGEAAVICYLSQSKVIKLFESGTIQGYKIPNSRHRRIPHKNLLEFMLENKIPLDKLKKSIMDNSVD